MGERIYEKGKYAEYCNQVGNNKKASHATNSKTYAIVNSKSSMLIMKLSCNCNLHLKNGAMSIATKS